MGAMSRHHVLAGLAGLLALLVAVPSGSAAELPTDSGAPHLPAPTGSHPVGVTSLYLRDDSRPDPWVPSASARELMVSLWYPAREQGTRPARYLTQKESELLLAGAGFTDLPPDVLSRTRVNARTGAEPFGGRRSLPLVVLSPGFTWPRSSLTSLAEELASRGYVVAGIDHTYENFGQTFPDGRVVTCAACERPDIPDFEKVVVESRARDVSFVLDELTSPRPKWTVSALVDPSRVAMVGMSIGGASTGETMLADQRVRAGIDLDGTMFKDLPEGGLSRPFMLLGSAGDEESWTRNWPRLTGWKRWLSVTGAVHASFTDYDLLTRQLGIDLGSGLEGARSVEITRAYVLAFLDLHLRARPQPLLDAPSPHYPEITFHAP
jgi:dienelactone hydrolase